MNDLVERVARAMHTSEEWSSFWSNDDAMALARAAIRAVLSHFSEPGNISDAMSIAAVVKWQNDESGGSLQDWLETAIASAMRAALEEASR